MNEGIKKERKEEGDVVEKRKSARKKEPAFKYTRGQTGIRILATLFFIIVVWSILETLIFLVVTFQIIYTLIAEKPNLWIGGFANRTIAYFYRVLRYLTFNQDRMPFPFSQFPDEIEKPQVK
jgi:hypothetical protein